MLNQNSHIVIVRRKHILSWPI